MDVVYTFAGDGADPAQHAARQVNPGRGLGYGELSLSLTLLLRHCRGQVRRVYVVHGGTMLWGATYTELSGVARAGGLAEEQLRIIPQDDILPGDGPRWCHNSCVIEAHLWRLPGLSEAFLYLNDDMYIGRPLNLRHAYWGRDGRPLLDCCVMPGPPRNTAQQHCRNALAVYRRRHGRVGRRAVLGPVHFPALMLREACRIAWRRYGPDLRRMPPVRDAEHTLNFQLLSYLVAWDTGLARLRLFADQPPWNISAAFVEMEPEGLAHALRHRPHWVCINGVDQHTQPAFRTFVQQLAQTPSPWPTPAPRYPVPHPSRSKRALEIGAPRQKNTE